MTIPAQQMAQRAAAWAESEPAVRAAIVYGSLAQGTADAESDLDLIVVTEPGRRDALWERRAELGALVLGRPPAWSQEPAWQRPYRYQVYDDQLAELDLTLDEEHAAPWGALRRGFHALIDKAGVEARLRADLAAWRPREFDAPELNGGTWGWLSYLHGKLRHGETWFVRYGVMDTLNNRVVPLLGALGPSACHDLDPADVARLEQAAPASSEPGELRRSLRAVADLYGLALGRWAERTGQPVPQHSLAAPIRARLAE